MIVVKTREFRSNMTKYLKLVNEGEKVILTSRSNGSFTLIPLDGKENVTVNNKETPQKAESEE